MDLEYMDGFNIQDFPYHETPGRKESFNLKNFKSGKNNQKSVFFNQKSCEDGKKNIFSIKEQFPNPNLDGDKVAEKIIMRIAKPQDADSLRELINETIDTCYFRIYPQEAIDYFKGYHNRTNIVNDIMGGHCLILASGEEFIGTGTLLGSNARRVFVKPGYQNMGLGKKIMYGLEERALEKGIRIMDLDASLVAYPFYRVLGYETQEEDIIPVKNGKCLRYYKMVKKLGD